VVWFIAQNVAQKTLRMLLIVVTVEHPFDLQSIHAIKEIGIWRMNVSAEGAEKCGHYL
jgi:hypothetical protein